MFLMVYLYLTLNSNITNRRLEKHLPSATYKSLWLFLCTSLPHLLLPEKMLIKDSLPVGSISHVQINYNSTLHTLRRCAAVRKARTGGRGASTQKGEHIQTCLRNFTKAIDKMPRKAYYAPGLTQNFTNYWKRTIFSDNLTSGANPANKTPTFVSISKSFI